MVYRITLVAAIVLVFSASLLAQRRMEAPFRPAAMPTWQCQRIVSMAPSITETLYALGLGDQVVGVTRDCKYPPEAQEKPRIGGYYDPNYEVILSLKPDLVVMLEEHEQSLPGFEKLKLETLIVSHQTVEGVIESFRTIGRVCGKGPEGRRLAYDFERRLRRIREETRLLPKPRVLMALDRTMGSGHLADVYVVGGDDYFDRMIELAGGQNAYTDRRVRYPVLSPEGMLGLNPDVIVELVCQAVLEQTDRKTIADDWNDLGQVEAVKRHRILVFDQEYATVPGPRCILLIEDMARALHPEVNWDGTDEDTDTGYH
jgi:iron complex transport system substrate-binding protein